jgi:hypothetical protein
MFLPWWRVESGPEGFLIPYTVTGFEVGSGRVVGLAGIALLLAYIVEILRSSGRGLIVAEMALIGLSVAGLLWGAAQSRTKEPLFSLIYLSYGWWVAVGSVAVSIVVTPLSFRRLGPRRVT